MDLRSNFAIVTVAVWVAPKCARSQSHVQILLLRAVAGVVAAMARNHAVVIDIGTGYTKMGNTAAHAPDFPSPNAHPLPPKIEKKEEAITNSTNITNVQK